MQAAAPRHFSGPAPSRAARCRRSVAVHARAVQFRPCIDIHKVRQAIGWRLAGCQGLLPAAAARAFAAVAGPPNLHMPPNAAELQGKVKQIVGSTLQDLQG